MSPVRIFLPALLGVIFLLTWEGVVIAREIPPYILPRPSAIWAAFNSRFDTLIAALYVTFRITLIAFFWAVLVGLALAVVFTRARLVEMALYPYFITLQVTPVVSIAPLILIWVGFENVERALILIAWIVAFFPMLTNSVLGIRSTDPLLRDMMRLSGAKWWQTLIHLELPTALPNILAGAKISAGLALIGAVVAEFVAGSGNSTGLAWRIIEAGNRLEIDVMFASLVLLSVLGITIFYALSWLEWQLLRGWHESFSRRKP